MMYQLNEQEELIVSQVVGVMEAVGYSQKRVKNQRGNLRGLLKRGYEPLRTVEGRNARLQEPSSLAARQALQKSMGLIAKVYGLEVGLHLSRKGTVSLHQHIPPSASWPAIDSLFDGYEETEVAARLKAQRSQHNNSGGRPVSKAMVKKMLDLSTAHVPGPDPDWGAARAESHAFGWILFLNSAVEEAHMPCPEWLKPIVKYALDNDCILVNFDQDADICEVSDLETLAGTKTGFKTYNW